MKQHLSREELLEFLIFQLSLSDVKKKQKKPRRTASKEALRYSAERARSPHLRETIERVARGEGTLRGRSRSRKKNCC
jgi:uncharacterized sporulation protein YeaH/YhbH (DUF444 family)